MMRFILVEVEGKLLKFKVLDFKIWIEYIFHLNLLGLLVMKTPGVD